MGSQAGIAHSETFFLDGERLIANAMVGPGRLDMIGTFRMSNPVGSIPGVWESFKLRVETSGDVQLQLLYTSSVGRMKVLRSYYVQLPCEQVQVQFNGIKDSEERLRAFASDMVLAVNAPNCSPDLSDAVRHAVATEQAGGLRSMLRRRKKFGFSDVV